MLEVLLCTEELNMGVWMQELSLLCDELNMCVLDPDEDIYFMLKQY